MSNKDTVQLFLGNETSDGRMTDIQDYSANIKSYNIRYDLFRGAGSFNAILDTRIELKLAQKPLKFVWKINGKAMMVGYVDKKELSYNKGQFNQTLNGRDMMQVLLDNFVLKQDPYENKTLDFIINDVYNKSRSVSSITNLSDGKQVIRKLSTPLSIPQVTFLYTTEAKNLAGRIKNFKHIKSRHGNSLFDFISQICNQIGLFLYNIPGTNEILIHATPALGTTSIKSFDRDGLITSDPPYPFNNLLTDRATNNVIACTFSEDIYDFHKFIKLVGQAQDEETTIASEYYASTSKLSKSELKIEKIEGVDENKSLTISAANIQKGYKGITKFTVSNVNECDIQAWNSTRDLIINNLLLQQNRKLYNIRYTVADHSPKDSTDPYFFNHIAIVSDDYLGIKDANFLVYAVEYKGSKDGGLTADITLCLPTSEVPGL